ncbi:IclR family transcriptional regulator domain-containing protein, partial [Enterobacter cloacae complex sp.6701988]
TRLPIGGTSTGRALLARLPVNERTNLINLEPEDTRSRLKERIDAITQRGWEFSVNESVAGVASVSSTVYDPSQNTLYALCLSLPESQMTDEIMTQLSQD